MLCSKVHGQWVLGFYVCIIWTGSDVILSTTSIMHLCAIALYRYHGIAYPLHLRSARHRRHVAALVVPAWSVAVALSVPFVIQGVRDPSHVLQAVELDTNETLLQCGIFNRTFAVYSSLVSFFIPLAVMIFADFRSIQILRTHIKLPMNTGDRNRKSRFGELSCREGAADIAKLSASSVSTMTSQTSTSQPVATANQSKPLITSSCLRPSTTQSCSRTHVTSSFPRTTFEPQQANDDVILDIESPVANSGVVHLPVAVRGRSRSKSMVYINMLASCGSAKVNGRERRAEKTLIWVFAAFVVLWLPFFCTNLIYGLCGEGCHIPGAVFQVFSWLGYLSSGVNPCIYTLLNHDFRNAFKNLLMCRRQKLKATNTVNCGHVPGLKRHD